MTTHVLIAGAGIGGLTAGIALKKAGFSVELHERADAIREVGAGLTIQANAVKALAELGLAGKLGAIGAKVEMTKLLNASGRVLFSDCFEPIAKVAGFPAYGVHRAALQKLLHDTLGHDLVRLNSRATGYRIENGRAVLELEGGRRAEGDVLVGADGIRSAIRAQLLHDGEPRYSGYTCWRGITERAGLVDKGFVFETWGRGARFGGVTLGDGKFYWFAPVNAPQGGHDAPGETKKRLLERYGEWARPIPAIIEATSESAIFRNDIIDRPFAERWGDGPVTLLGDAAHAMTPNLGQGACQAIEDAIVLARALAKAASPVEGLRRYEDLRRERTRKVVETAWKLGRIGQWESSLARFVRDTLVAWTPTSVQRSQVLWTQRFELVP